MQADLQNAIITGYNITYQSLIENDNGFVKASPNDRQGNLTGLKEFVEYNISVVAFAVKGAGPPFVFIVGTNQDRKSYTTCFFCSYYYCNQCQRLFCLIFFSGKYSNAQADVMISCIDVYILTLTFFGIRSIERTLRCISRLYY